MRLYETGFLISPTLPEEEAENIIQQMSDVVSQKMGNMIKLEKWGKRRLAFPLKNFEEAYYVFFHYEGEPGIPAELGRRFKQMDTILRHMTLIKDRRENVRKKKSAQESEESEKTSSEESSGMDTDKDSGEDFSLGEETKEDENVKG